MPARQPDRILYDGVDIRTEASGKPAFQSFDRSDSGIQDPENDFSADSGRNPVAINLSLRPGTNDLPRQPLRIFCAITIWTRAASSPLRSFAATQSVGAVVSGPVIRNKTFFMANL